MNVRFLPSGRLLAALLALVLAAFALAACGGDDSDDTTAADTTAVETTTDDTASSGGAAETVSFEADPNGDLAYVETEVSAASGEATIEFDNPSSTGHDVVIEDDSGGEIAATDIVSGTTTSTTADLEAGSFTFFCSVPGHREAGMEGTLTVK